MRRVVVTGLGIVSAAGSTKESFWFSLANGKTGLKAISFERSAEAVSAGRVDDFSFPWPVEPKKLKLLAKGSRFCLAAGQAAIEDAQINDSGIDREKFGVSLGSSTGETESSSNELHTILERGVQYANPFLAISFFPGTLVGAVSIPLSLEGPGLLISTGDASGSDAIGNGYEFIKTGKADAMLCGGVETPIEPLTIKTLASMDLLAAGSKASAFRPFDKQRSGFILGEGAALLILEELGFALKRKARIYCEIAGYASSFDSLRLKSVIQSKIRYDKAEPAIGLAMKEAGTDKEEIDFISLQGAGTKAGDRSETKLIKKFFGQTAYHIPMSAMQPVVGNTLGAIGAMQAVGCCLMFEKQFAPPTINLTQPDPNCDLDYVPNLGRTFSPKTILQNSLSLLGQNSFLIYRRLDV